MNFHVLSQFFCHSEGSDCWIDMVLMGEGCWGQFGYARPFARELKMSGLFVFVFISWMCYQVLLELGALLASLVDVREMSGYVTLNNHDTERVHMLSRQWVESMTHMFERNRWESSAQKDTNKQIKNPYRVQLCCASSSCCYLNFPQKEKSCNQYFFVHFSYFLPCAEHHLLFYNMCKVSKLATNYPIIVRTVCAYLIQWMCAFWKKEASTELWLLHKASYLVCVQRAAGWASALPELSGEA